jgi:hypothetical protein
MRDGDELIRLEREAWKALTTSGDAAQYFYDHVLANDVLILMPGGLVMDTRDAVVAVMHEADWTDVEASDERVVPLSPDAAVVAYRATAKRWGSEYTALFNSTYVRESGQWRLKVHQQTPL